MYNGGLKIFDVLPKAQDGLMVDSFVKKTNFPSIDFLSNIKKVKRIPSPPPKRTEYVIVDPRNKNKRTPVALETVTKIIDSSLAENYNPYNALSVAFQETNMGEVDGNPFHVITRKGESRHPDSIINGIQVLKEKEKLASRLGLNSEEYKFQAFNGLGKLFPSTERGYDGGGDRYGVHIPEEGISMRENPLYGKRIIDIRNNILMQDPTIKKLVSDREKVYLKNKQYSEEMQRMSQRKGDGHTQNILRAPKMKDGGILPTDFDVNPVIERALMGDVHNIPKFQFAGRYGYIPPSTGDLRTNHQIPSNMQYAQQAEMRRQQAEQIALAKDKAANPIKYARPKFVSVSPAKEMNVVQKAASDAYMRNYAATVNPYMEFNEDSRQLQQTGVGRWMENNGKTLDRAANMGENMLAIGDVMGTTGLVRAGVKQLGKSAIAKNIKEGVVNYAKHNYHGQMFEPNTLNMGFNPFSFFARTPKPNFKSEINWSTWNKEIPKNSQLMKEYNAIEQASKANGSWMKNSDGSMFQGTPEQFVQQNSENFKKAYPDGAIITYKGVGARGRMEKIKTVADNPYTIPFFTGDKNMASGYTSIYHNSKSPIISHNNKKFNEAANAEVHQFYFRHDPKQIRLDLENQYWGGFKLPKKATQSDEIYQKIKKQIEEVEEISSTGTLQDVIKENNLKYIGVDNIVEGGGTGTSYIINPLKENVIKSAVGNNGMFDMTNPNIYKSILGPVVGIGTAASVLGVQPEKKAFQSGGLWNTNRTKWVDSTLNANRGLDFVKRLYQKNTPSIQIPGELGRSTHFMKYDPGTRRVYPSVVNQHGNLRHLLGGDAPWDYADNTGEYITFPTVEQAQWFGSDGYKQGKRVLKSFRKPKKK